MLSLDQLRLTQGDELWKSCMEVCPYRFFRCCGYFRGPWVSFVTTEEFSERVTKITSRIGVKWTHSLPFCFWPIFNFMKWSYHRKDVNQIMLNHTTLSRSLFQFCWTLTFLESNSPDSLAVCETNLDDSIDSGNFSVTGYPPLIRKESVTLMHGLAVYVKEGLPFAWYLSLENSADFYLCFWLALLDTVSYFFFLCRSPSSSLYIAFDAISSNIDEVLSINPSANVFVFGDINVCHKDWLTYSVGTDRPGELCYNFISLMALLRWLTFLLGSLTVDASLCYTVAFPPLGTIH